MDAAIALVLHDLGLIERLDVRLGEGVLHLGCLFISPSTKAATSFMSTRPSLVWHFSMASVRSLESASIAVVSSTIWSRRSTADLPYNRRIRWRRPGVGRATPESTPLSTTFIAPRVAPFQ